MHTILRHRWTSLAAFLLMAQASHAQTDTAQQSELRAAVIAGLHSSNRLNAEIHQLESDVYQANIQFGELLPRVDLRGATGYERIQGDAGNNRSYNASSVGIEARQNLFNGFASHSRYLSDHAKAMRQYFVILDEADKVAAEAAKAYLNVARAQAISDLAQYNVNFHQDLLEKIEAKVNQGVSRKADLEQAKSRHSLSLSQLASEKANLFSAAADYQRVTGEIWPMLQKANYRIESNIDLSNPDRLTYALNFHHLISAAKSDYLAADYAASASEEGFFPRVDLRAKSDRYSNYLSTFEDRRISSIDLLATVNLYKGGADDAAREFAIRQRYKAVDMKLEACKNVRRNTQVALYGVQNLERRVDYFTDQATAMTNARAAYEQQFLIGRRTLIELLDAENEHTQAQRNLVNVETDLSIAKINLLAASGQLLRTLELENEIQVEKPLQRQLVLYKENLQHSQSPDLECPKELISLEAFSLPAPSMPASLVKSEPGLGQPSPQALVVADSSGDTASLDPAVASGKLIDLTKNWAKAWEDKDVNTYISFYSPFFKPEGKSYERWEMERRDRIGKANGIEITVSEIQVIPDFDDVKVFETSFIQSYKASHYREVSRKVLTWRADERGTWKIIKEQNLPVDTVKAEPKTQKLALTSQG